MILRGYSNLGFIQLCEAIHCKAPGLQLLKHKAMEKLDAWPKYDLLHVKRDWNASAYRLASEVLQKMKGEIVMDDQDRQDLVTLNCLDELMLPRTTNHRVRAVIITRDAA